MNCGELPTNLSVIACNHVFEETHEIVLFGREASGEFVAICGCEVERAHVVGFGHLIQRLQGLLGEPVPKAGTHYLRKDGEWVIGSVDELNS